MSVILSLFGLFPRPRRSQVLWLAWWRAVASLRPACSRQRTFLWLVLVLAALCLRPDLAGVSSLVRGLELSAASYYCLLHFFHSPALNLDRLTRLWQGTLTRLLGPYLVRWQGRPIALVDGLKRSKEAQKMPAVKSLHQESTCNTKAPYIMGHSIQAIALLVQAAGVCLAVPLAARIHEGLVWSNRDRRSLIDKLAILWRSLDWPCPMIVVADSAYAVGKLMRLLLKAGHQVVSRVRISAVGYLPAAPPKRKRRGRRRRYGRKIKLREQFAQAQRFSSALSPVYGESGLRLRYYCRDLLWRPLGQVVRFVWVIHPQRGRLILLCTDLSIAPLDIIRLYGWRAKIEVSFKAAIHTLGTYAYHFWMRTMEPIERGSGNQHLHRRSQAYRQGVRRKLCACQTHIQLGLIAQGLLQYLAVRFRCLSWFNFRSYLRTLRTERAPSEWVVAQALRHTWPEFLVHLPQNHSLKKFLASQISRKRCSYARLFELEEAA